MNPTEKLRDLVEWWETKSWVLRIRLRMLILGGGALAVFLYSLGNWEAMTSGVRAVASILAFLVALAFFATMKEILNL